MNTDTKAAKDEYIKGLSRTLMKYWFECVTELEKAENGKADRRMIFATMMKAAWSFGIKLVLKEEITEQELLQLSRAAELGLANTIDSIMFQNENK